MALFDTEHYGKIISEQLADYLNKYTTASDRANVSEATGVGVTTLRNIVYRTNNLTENNSIGVLELMRTAIANAKQEKSNAINAVKYFSKQVEKEAV